MPAEDAMLFIDANKFLDLYRTDTGKKLLAPVGEQVEYIFVTQQVVNEVQRNKIQVATDYLSNKFKDLKLQTFNVPDHLAGTKSGQGKEVLQQMSEIVQKIKNVNEEVDALALGIVEKISRSEDEVSKALAPVFAKAVPHSQEELQRARDRRELGNPPGKSVSPIGDQLTWEQILTHFKGKRRLWIISRDGDYGTVYDGKGFLNRFLYDELSKMASAPEVYLFADTVEGIKHFVDTTGVKAEQQLTPEEIKEVEEEEKALPNLSQPTEAMQRVMAEFARVSQQGEAMQRVVAEMARVTEPAYAVQRVMAEMATKINEPARAVQQVMAEMATRVIQPAEAMQRVMAEMATVTQPAEAMQRVMAEVMKVTQPAEDMRRMMAEITKPSEEMQRMIARLYQPVGPFHQSPMRLQEEKDEQPPTPPPSSQKGGTDGKKDEEEKAG